MVRDLLSFCGWTASDQLVTLEINCHWTPNLDITTMHSAPAAPHEFRVPELTNMSNNQQIKLSDNSLVIEAVVSSGMKQLAVMNGSQLKLQWKSAASQKAKKLIFILNERNLRNLEALERLGCNSTHTPESDSESESQLPLLSLHCYN